LAEAFHHGLCPLSVGEGLAVLVFGLGDREDLGVGVGVVLKLLKQGFDQHFSADAFLAAKLLEAIAQLRL
jgi:hypothetical protein